MTVLEAWAHAKPVLMTPECNLPEGFEANAALRIGTTPEEIAAGLKVLREMSDNDRSQMGNRGRALVATRFSWPRIGEQMRDVYEWVLGGGAVPKSVRLTELVDVRVRSRSSETFLELLDNESHAVFCCHSKRSEESRINSIQSAEITQDIFVNHVRTEINKKCRFVNNTARLCVPKFVAIANVVCPLTCPIAC